MGKEKSNNRNYSIPMAIVLTIILSLVPLAMAYGTLTQKVDELEQEDQEKIDIIISLEERIIVLEKIAAGTEVSLNVIKEDVGEIKSDIKFISEAMRYP